MSASVSGRLLTAVFVCALFSLAACSKTQQATTTTSQTAEPAASPDVTETPLAASGASPEAAATATPEVGFVASPAASGAATVAFTDVGGIDGETAIKQLGALGVLGTTSGEFKPHAPITRAEYVRWLVKANNIYAAKLQMTNNRIRLAETSTSTFTDVPSSDPDFRYIQGMADAGLLVGYDPTHFKPTKNLSREELIAILVQRNLNGGTPPPADKAGPPQQIGDGTQVSKAYWGLFSNDQYIYGGKNVTRVFGSIKTLHPQQDATREEAAVALQSIYAMDAGEALKR